MRWQRCQYRVVIKILWLDSENLGSNLNSTNYLFHDSRWQNQSSSNLHFLIQKRANNHHLLLWRWNELVSWKTHRTVLGTYSVFNARELVLLYVPLWQLQAHVILSQASLLLCLPFPPPRCPFSVVYHPTFTTTSRWGSFYSRLSCL